MRLVQVPGSNTLFLQQRDLENAADSHGKILVSPSEMKFLLDLGAMS